MRYIALFFPAMVSLGIKYKRNSERKWIWLDFLYEYAVSLICNVLLTQSLISYGFRMGSVNIEAFDSFPFFTKYITIASFLAIIIPYISAIVKANISVSFEIEKKKQ